MIHEKYDIKITVKVSEELDKLINDYCYKYSLKKSKLLRSILEEYFSNEN